MPLSLYQNRAGLFILYARFRCPAGNLKFEEPLIHGMIEKTNLEYIN